jgi:hypothetical protein
MSTIKVTPHEAVDYIKDIISAKLVPMLSGDPGIGKSDIIAQILEVYNLQMLDIRLSQYDPSELNGYPSIKNNRAAHIPLEIFPIEGDPLPTEIRAGLTPHTYAGWGIFFDEFNSSSLATQAAAYKVILNHAIGSHKLHKRAVSMCAGNLATNNAIVNRMSTAMQSRLVHLELQVDVDQWVQWANQHALDHRVIAYIQSVPTNLHNFDPDHNDHTFACPRTWEFTSKLIKKILGSLQPKLPLLAGTISEAIAREFVLYTDIYTELPTIKEIEANPTSIPISREPGILFALSNMVAAWAKDSNIDKLIQFVERLPLEFGTITLQNMIYRNSDMQKNKCVGRWIEQNAMHAF